MECSCEGMDEGFLTILKWITRLEEGRVACATVTGLQVVAWLGLAIWYVIMCSKKQSKEDMEDEMEEMKHKEWEESVKKMEVCLKANKRGRKGQREFARTREWNRKYEAAMRANKRDARLAMENQHFLNTHKGEAESQL